MIQILIVEDVPTMAELIKQAVISVAHLRVCGIAKNSAEAKVVLRKSRPDLVLLDEVLPGESSIDLLSCFVDEKIPVILISSMEHPQHPLPHGAYSRILKPNWKTLSSDSQRIQSAIEKAIAV